jgi:hypothetical protein
MRTLQHIAFDGLQKAKARRAGKAHGVDGQEHVGGAVGTLGLHPRDQLVGIAFDPVDRDAGGLGEVGIEPFVGVVVARGIEVQLLRLGCGQRRYGDGGAQKGGERAGHGGLPVGPK